MKRLIIFLVAFIVLQANAQNFTSDTTKGCIPTIITFSTTYGNVWEWDFGDGSTHSFTNPATHVYINPGIYTVKCTINFVDGSPQQIITKTNYIIISTGPIVDFSVDDTSICSSETVNFTSNVTPGGNAIASYLWNFGDGTSSTLASPSHAYKTNATHNVSLKVTDTMGCSKRLEKQNYIYIYNQPQANFSVSDSIFCVGNTSITKQISFTNNSSSDAVNYLWNFGDGTSDTMKNPATKTYGIGFYDVSLTVTNQYGCKDTLKKKDHIIITLFKANFNVSDSVLCKRGQNIQFTGTAYGANFYRWEFGDGQEGLGSYIQHTYNTPGKYTIKTIATSLYGCSDTMVKEHAIWVFDSIPAIIEVNDTDHCNPNAPIVFINKTITDSADDLGLAKAYWDFGDGIFAQGDTVSHVYGNFTSKEAKAWITTGYGCTLPVKTQQIDIYKSHVTTTQIVPNVAMGQKPGGCFPHSVSIAVDSLVSSSPITDYIWDWGETEVWGAAAGPDTTHTGQTPYATYIYNYDTGIYHIGLTIINQQGCRDTLTYKTIIPVGYPPINDWIFNFDMDCKSQLVIQATAYDSLKPSNGSLAAQSRADSWEWYDYKNNPIAFSNPGYLHPIDTGWHHNYHLIPYHNHCAGNIVSKDSIMYACPPMAGIEYPTHNLYGNPPVYCQWPVFGFDGSDGQKTKAWDSCVWKLGNYYTDVNGIYHPQTEILGNSTHPQGQIVTDNLYSYDTLGGMEMLTQRRNHLYVTLWTMNDNRKGNNQCGYCVDSAISEIIISIADMKLRATDIAGNIVNDICENQTIYFYDSSYATDGIYWWGLSMLHVNDSGKTFYSTEDMMLRMQSQFEHPNYLKQFFDTNNYTGSLAFPYYFNEWGTYHIYLKDTSAEGCGLNSNSNIPFIEWQQAHWGTKKPFEGRTDTLTLNVYPASIPAFSSNSPVCAGDTLELFDESYTPYPFSNFAITKYFWMPKFHKTDTAKNPKYLIRNMGNYDLSLTIYNEKGCDSTVLFHDSLIILGSMARFSTPQLPYNNRKVCNKDTVNFSNNSYYFDLYSKNLIKDYPLNQQMTYQWVFDNKDTVNSFHAQYAFNVDSSRYVHISINATDPYGCSSYYLDSIFIIRPVADFNATTHEIKCPPLDINFQNLSHDLDTGLATYEWIFGDTISMGNNISYIKDPLHTYNYAGNYDVTLIATDIYNCSDTLTKLQFVKVGGPYGTIHADTLFGCSSLNTTFYFNVTNFGSVDTLKDTLFVYFGDGTYYFNDSSIDPTSHTYTQPGYYMPIMVLNKWEYNPITGLKERCMQGFPLKDSIKVIGLTADFNIENANQEIITDGSKIIKPNDTAYFFDQSVLQPYDFEISYFWDFGNGDTITTLQSTYSYAYSDTGIYNIALQITHKTCVSSPAVHTLIVNESDNISEYKQLPNIEIYPNPVTSAFRIKAENTSIKYVEVVDLLGNVLLKTSNISREININHLSKGLYFIKIHTKEDIISKKIIKT